MPICLCCGEDVDFEQDYRPVLPFCSHCVSERCRKCRTWIRVRKFEQDPTFNLIGRPREPRMKCGWGCGAQLTGRNMQAHFTICPKRPAGSPNGDCRTRSSKVKRGRPPGPRMKCGWVVATSLRRVGCDRISRHARGGQEHESCVGDPGPKGVRGTAGHRSAQGSTLEGELLSRTPARFLRKRKLQRVRNAA
jgi:hypothetical protein